MSQVFRDNSTQETKQDLEIQFLSGAVRSFPPPPSGEENGSLASLPNEVTSLSGVAKFFRTMVSSYRAADLQELEKYHTPLH